TVLWRLDARAECAGPDLWLRFDLPVFEAADSSAALEPASRPDADEAVRERPDARTLAALGIVYERSSTGVESWTFRRAQHKSVAATVVAIAAVFGAAAVGLWIAAAPRIFALAFAGFDALFFWLAADLLFTEYSVTLDRGLLTVARRGLARARAPVQ